MGESSSVGVGFGSEHLPAVSTTNNDTWHKLDHQVYFEFVVYVRAASANQKQALLYQARCYVHGQTPIDARKTLKMVSLQKHACQMRLSTPHLILKSALRLFTKDVAVLVHDKWDEGKHTSDEGQK